MAPTIWRRPGGYASPYPCHSTMMTARQNRRRPAAHYRAYDSTELDILRTDLSECLLA